MKTLLKMVYDKYIKERADKAKKLLDELKDAIKDAAEEAGESLGIHIFDIIEWIRSSDPVRARFASMIAKSLSK